MSQVRFCFSNSWLLSHLYSSGNNHNTNNYTTLNTKYLLIKHQLPVFWAGKWGSSRECGCELHGNECTVQLSPLQILPILSNSHSTEILTLQIFAIGEDVASSRCNSSSTRACCPASTGMAVTEQTTHGEAASKCV